MEERDRIIGENLARLRGSTSQQVVADAMRLSGFRWSQATVWSIEKGERPLRLAEAEALARVLSVASNTEIGVGDLLAKPPTHESFAEVLTQMRDVAGAAGMLSHVDLATSGEGGRPDMIVHLPGGKIIGVDAKTPAGFQAVRDHVTALGSKNYWQALDGSPEIVIAFIPSESLLSAALEADPSIMEFAFSKRVALASPVNLFVLLKTVAASWQHETTQSPEPDHVEHPEAS